MKAVLFTMAATFLIQMGYFLWKLSAEGQPKIGGAPVKQVIIALFTDWRWVLGLLSTSIGWLLFIQATALGDISLVQPLMSAGDFILVIMVVVFLKERLGRFEWAGVVTTVIGAIILASQATDSQTTNYVGMDLLILVGAITFLGILLFTIRNKNLISPEVILAMVVGLCFGLGAILTKAMTVQFANDEGSFIQLHSWLKMIHPLLPAVILANVLGLTFLQTAFQRGRAAVIVPLQLAMANAVTVLAGVIIFAENVTSIRAVGITFIVVGTGLLQIKTNARASMSEN